MNHQPDVASYARMCILILAAFAYALMLQSRLPFTGKAQLDGSVGVVLGLFIASRPASHMLDVILYRGRGRLSAREIRAELFWVAFNVLVLLTGFLVIVLGTTRFTSTGG